MSEGVRIANCIRRILTGSARHWLLRATVRLMMWRKASGEWPKAR